MAKKAARKPPRAYRSLSDAASLVYVYNSITRHHPEAKPLSIWKRWTKLGLVSGPFKGRWDVLRMVRRAEDRISKQEK